MKKTLPALVLALVLALVPLAAAAAPSAMNMFGSGGGSLGSMVTVAVEADGSDISALSGTLQYDTSAVSFVSAKGENGCVVTVDERPELVMLSFDLSAAPVSGQTRIATLTFQVIEVKDCSFTLSGVYGMDSDGETEPSAATWRLAAPLTTPTPVPTPTPLPTPTPIPTTTLAPTPTVTPIPAPPASHSSALWLVLLIFLAIAGLCGVTLLIIIRQRAQQKRRRKRPAAASRPAPKPAAKQRQHDRRLILDEEEPIEPAAEQETGQTPRFAPRSKRR
ncbi:MAG: hypothetical protein IJP30_04435 [Clostridia bacterium]|nr:hypothetical protein [Clostridia bacterium]